MTMTNDQGCPHGKTWSELCDQCAIESARNMVEYFETGLKEARRRVERLTLKAVAEKVEGEWDVVKRRRQEQAERLTVVVPSDPDVYAWRDADEDGVVYFPQRTANVVARHNRWTEVD